LRLNQLQHPEVRYEVTDLCNASCVMCPREKHDRAHGIMDQGKYERSIDEIVTLGAKRVVLTGFGEPLLDKNLEHKIAYAKRKGLGTYIITNGSVLTQKRRRGLIDAELDEMRISFYGMWPGSYNAVMRGLRFDTTVERVLAFLRERKSTRVQLSYLVLPENKADVNEFIAYWEPKVDAIEVWKPHNFGDGRDYRQRDVEKTTCGRPANGPLQIQWNGEVIPCCYDYNNQIILGNAFDQPILDILYGKRYTDLRTAHTLGEFHKYPYCDQCDQLLKRDDALIYSSRHNLKGAEAVKLSNTDLHNLIDNVEWENEISDSYENYGGTQ